LNKEAKATADWVVRVLNEAETLPLATNLDVHQQAYLMACDNEPRRVILLHFVNDLFFTTTHYEPDSPQAFQMRREAGLYISGET
jgi:hypothetical protein